MHGSQSLQALGEHAGVMGYAPLNKGLLSTQEMPFGPNPSYDVITVCESLSLPPQVCRASYSFLRQTDSGVVLHMLSEMEERMDRKRSGLSSRAPSY